MDSRSIGGILLITGTSIGAGMLGLPIAAANLGFSGSFILLIVCWLVTLACALLILEVNQWLPHNSNIITMAKATIGPWGQIFAWISYLLLLYSLLCAYIAGGSDLFHNLLNLTGYNLPNWACALIFTLIFGSVVYCGMSSVDIANRVLMLIKFGTLFMAVFFLIPSISVHKLASGNLHYLTSVSAIMVTTAAFGWATLVPSLRVYFENDIKKLKRAIFIGSLIPVICYIIWDAAILGVIPLFGKNSIEFIAQTSNSTSSLVNILSVTMSNNSITFFIRLFTSVCVLTSFLGVALCLTDFLSDGLQLEKKESNNIAIHLLTFIPALLIAIYFPNAFMKALEYAGICATFLLILLPAWMAWCGRYQRSIATGFKVYGGKPFLAAIIVLSSLVIIRGILN